MLLVCVALGLFLVAWTYRRPHEAIVSLPGGALSDMRFSPDSRMLLVEREIQVSPKLANVKNFGTFTTRTFYSQTSAYNRTERSLLWQTAISPGETMPRFSRDSRLTLVQNGPELQLRDARTWRLKWAVKPVETNYGFGFSPNEKLVSCWPEVRDARTGRQVFHRPMNFLPGRNVCLPTPRWINNHQLRFITFPTISGGKRDPALLIHTVDIRTGKVETLPSLRRNMDIELSGDGQSAIILVKEENPARNTLQLWDFKRNQRLQQWPAPGEDELFSWLDGQSGFIFYGRNQDNERKGLQRYVNAQNRQVKLLPHWTQGGPPSVNSRWSLVFQRDRLALRDRSTGQVARLFDPNVTRGVISPDERTIATAERNDQTQNTDIRLWDLDK